MYNFDYVRAFSIADAIATIAEADAGKYLAGGMTLIPTLKQRLARPSLLVDLAGIDALRDVRVEATSLVIGSMVSHDKVMRSAEVRRCIPALALLAGVIGDPQVRNRGTLGGSIANNDPAADYPAALVGLGATVITDRRHIAAEDFFSGMFETPLAVDEVIVEVAFPIPLRAGYAKLRQPASRYALVGVFVAVTPTGVRVAVTGAGPSVVRHIAMEEALEERFSPAAIEHIATDANGLNTDIHGSAAYRAHLVRVMAVRALAAVE